MSYTQDLRNSADRHYKAGEILFNSKPPRKDVAGYLYGIAAECAVKALMRGSDISALDQKKRREDPFYAHFPELKTLLVNRIQGRNSSILQKFIAAPFMQEWDTTMRYAPAKDIQDTWVERWREHAKQAIHHMNGN